MHAHDASRQPCEWAQQGAWLNVSIIYTWLVKTLHNMLLSFALSLVLFLPSWLLLCFLFLSVANCWRCSALNSAKHISCGGPAALFSVSSIVKKRRSSLSSTSIVSARDAWVSERARECKWAQLCKLKFLSVTDTCVRMYVHTYIARIDPSFKASH